MNIIKTSKIKTTIEVITHQTDLGMDIVEQKTNGKIIDIFFTCKESGLTPVLLDLPENWIEEYDYFDYFEKHRYYIKNIKDFNEEDLYFVYRPGHKIFDKNKKIISMPLIFDYCQSICEVTPNDKTFAKIIRLLKEHPFCLELEISEIPSFNADFKRQQGIQKAKVLVSQEKYENYYDRVKGFDNWDSLINSAIRMSFCSYGIYGEEIDTLLKKHWRD